MDALVKIDLEQVLDSGDPVLIELGCGDRKKAGRIGVDAIDLPGVDVVADLEKGLAFLPDNSVDQIHCRSLLEHIDNFENLIAEIVRVLKIIVSYHRIDRRCDFYLDIQNSTVPKDEKGNQI